MDAEERVGYIVRNLEGHNTRILFYIINQLNQHIAPTQPGTMYYQPDPPNVFGEPVSEEEDEERSLKTVGLFPTLFVCRFIPETIKIYTKCLDRKIPSLKY